MTDRRPNPTETIELIERLRKMKFDNDSFGQLHHLHGSMDGFEKYARKVASFQEDGNNHRVHKRMLFVLDSCANGTPPPGKTFAALAEEAMRSIPPI
jgi:hypothetical protein